MTRYYDLLVSARDAETLASVVGDNGFEHEAADALADLMMEARLVPTGELPATRVAMNSSVTYRESNGAKRTVRIVHPRDADPAVRRISVLSPVGRALLGRERGSTVRASLPGGRDLDIRILDVER
jgi:regulator of nucleoside diphosphate kinase